MFEHHRMVMKELNRSIFVGERYEKNMRGISYGAVLIVVMNIITGGLNLMNGYYSAIVAAVMFILAGLCMLFFTRIRHDRRGAVVTATIAAIVIFTYEVFAVEHGFPIFWTLLLPLAFCYFADVKSGIAISLYFLALYAVLFLTPLHSDLGLNYSDIIVQRFPILYLANVALTGYIMVQYHLTTLRQMDDAEQLLEAKEAADRANEAKTDFLANMSHEIRTPINAVLGLNEMILRESDRAKGLPVGSQRETREALDRIGSYADDVRTAGSNLLSIVNDILDVSKIESGRMEIAEAPYSLGSLLNDLIGSASFTAESKGLQFVADVDETLPDELVGDRLRVRQVIANVLTNALKYTDQGSVCLRVRGNLEQGNEPGRTMRLDIEVSDTGRGIKPEDIENLFSKFQRMDMDRNSTIEGTGLGLAITRNLLTMMGGSIRAESEYGVGSTFSIDLPQVIASSEPTVCLRDQARKDCSQKTADVETFRAPNARILIVDDTKMNLTVATGLLQGTEMLIDVATGGMQAVELAQANVYDLILMDQRMPEMDGIEALKLIRVQEGGANRETPVICLTADAVIGAKERYLAEGFTDYLSKPIDSRELESMLLKHLPEEKVVLVSRETVVEDVAEGGVADAYVSLRAASIDPVVGLSYCQDDEALYRSLLDEYARSSREKMPDMARYREARDWGNLAILAHSVKSTSRMIGAEELSELAASIEQAADAGDAGAVERSFPRLMARYGEAVDAIRLLIPEADEPAIEDDEILEFLPE